EDLPKRTYRCFLPRDTIKTAGVAGIPVAVALLCIGLQNRATTGSYLSMPYQVHEQQYGVAPLFVFGAEKVPTRFAQATVPETVRTYHEGWSLDSFKSRVGIAGFVKGLGTAIGLIVSYWGVGIGLLGTIAILFGAKFSVGRSVFAILMVQLIVSSTVCWVYPHYLAPITACLLCAAVCLVQRCVRVAGRADLMRQSAVPAVVLILVQIFGLAWAVVRLSRSEHDAWAKRRAELAASLKETPGKDLVFVHYAESHNVHQEWVYNAANLPQAEIIWARGERPKWQEQVDQAYGSERLVWELRVGDNMGQNVELSLISKPVLIRGAEFTAPENRWTCFD
ncbi:MAG: hypothetical protein AAGG44_18495, partial [Planctomycetota bacterium]